jgi:hypothetical protein
MGEFSLMDGFGWGRGGGEIRDFGARGLIVEGYGVKWRDQGDDPVLGGPAGMVATEAR